jgi:hypothetical protein
LCTLIPHNFSNVGVLFRNPESIAVLTSLLCNAAPFHMLVYLNPSAIVWSRLQLSNSFVPCTATGLFAEIVVASFNPSFTASPLLPYTALTNPTLSASSAPNTRALRHISLTQEKEPTILGSRERVPISAAMPLSTSLTANFVVLVQRRISAVAQISMARPKA